MYLDKKEKKLIALLRSHEWLNEKARRPTNSNTNLHFIPEESSNNQFIRASLLYIHLHTYYNIHDSFESVNLFKHKTESNMVQGYVLSV